MKSLGFIAVLAFGACSAAIAGGPRSEDQDALRARFDREFPPLLAKAGVPSVSIAHIENGKVIFTAAYGVQRPGVPATTRTLYNIASMTKPIAAEVVLQLASDGLFSLDASMAPAWVDPDITDDERHKLLTPRIALSHRTGFPNWRYLTKDKLIFQYAPGEGVGYSGEGYEYVARFAEKKNGRSFDTLVRERIFKPFGMKDSSFRREQRFENRYAIPTEENGTLRKLDFTEAGWDAADNLYTTPSDYARFMIAVMRHSRLDAAIAQQREQVQADDRAKHCDGEKAKTCPDALGFGLGWEVLHFGDKTLLMHTGQDYGEFTFGYINPADRTGTVLFTNSAVGYRLVLPVLRRFGRDPELVAYLRAQAGAILDAIEAADAKNAEQGGQ